MLYHKLNILNAVNLPKYLIASSVILLAPIWPFLVKSKCVKLGNFNKECKPLSAIFSILCRCKILRMRNNLANVSTSSIGVIQCPTILRMVVLLVGREAQWPLTSRQNFIVCKIMLSSVTEPLVLAFGLSNNPESRQSKSLLVRSA